MKNFLPHCRLFTVVVAVLITLGVRAGNDIILKQGNTSKLVISAVSYQHLRVVNTLPALRYSSVRTSHGEFAQLQAEEYAGSDTYGSPQLPVMHKLIEIPLGARPTVKIISYNVKEYRLEDLGLNLKLFPAQPPVSKSQSNPMLLYNASVYQQNSFTENEIATVDVLGMMRGTGLGRLNISPVQYNPVSGIIRIYDNLVIDITYPGADVSLTKAEKRRYDSPYFRTVYDRLINYQKSTNLPDTMRGFPVKYVIVSPRMFHDALQPFVAWKKKKGFTVVEAYTDDPAVGTTTASIKNFLSGLYKAATNTDPAPSFVLFAGDVAQIPAFPCAEGHVTDLYYCEYSGDYLPEVYYGRFSANTVAQLQPQIDKTLEYEQYRMPDPSFLNEVVMAAGTDEGHQLSWSNGQINYGTDNYFNAAHGLISHTYLQPEPSGADYSRQIRANISDGVGFANYTSHGSISGWYDPSLTISDIAGLKNAHKYPLMVGNCCMSSDYNGKSFAEELLRAADKGALGYIGCSNDSYWDEDYWWGVGAGPISANPTYEGTTLGAYDRTFHDHGEPYEEWYSTMDQMIFAGNLAVTESGSAMKRYYWEIYCLMGDPSLMVYFSQPLPMAVSYSPEMPVASTAFTVNAGPFAYVAISKDGVLYGAAEADAGGTAVVLLKHVNVPGLADVVVTKQNRQPYFGTVMVAIPEGPYVLLDSCRIDDSRGNNNQVADFGENIRIRIILKNEGKSDASGVTSTLSSNDEFVTISGNNIITPIIKSRSSLAAKEAFSVSVKSFIPDRHVAHFKVVSYCGTKNWSSDFTLTLYAPRLTTGQFKMDDATKGNGNGIIDPGETVIFSIPTVNSGHSVAEATTGTLLASGEFATLNNTGSDPGRLIAGESADAVFSVTVSPDAPAGSILPFHFIAASGKYNVFTSLYPVVGALAEDFETGGFGSFGWQMRGNSEWTITQNNPQKGISSARSGIIGDLQASVLYISGYVLMNDSISFYRKVSSESGFDFLKFYIDGQEMKSWSGILPWARVKFPVAAGRHIFRWSYEKDNSTKSGEDAAMIDGIVFPSFTDSLTIDVLASPATMCAGGATQLFGFAPGDAGNYTYAWSPSAGLSDTAIFNPVATPSGTETYTVQIDDRNSMASSGITITVNPLPLTPVITENGTGFESSVATGNQWYNSAGLIKGATDKAYAPERMDTYYVIASDQQGCSSKASESVATAFVYLKDNGPQLAIYPNPFNDKFKVSYKLDNLSKVKLAIYNAMGKEIAMLSGEGVQAAGQYNLELDGGYLPVGIYFCKLFAGNEVIVKKIMRTR